jgi:hypothetical protein
MLRIVGFGIIHDIEHSSSAITVLMKMVVNVVYYCCFCQCYCYFLVGFIVKQYVSENVRHELVTSLVKKRYILVNILTSFTLNCSICYTYF